LKHAEIRRGGGVRKKGKWDSKRERGGSDSRVRNGIECILGSMEPTKRSELI
jgi:hypothetical protein